MCGLCPKNLFFGPVFAKVVNHLVQSRKEGIALEHEFESVMDEVAKNGLSRFGGFDSINFLKFKFLRALKIGAYCRVRGSHDNIYLSTCAKRSSMWVRQNLCAPDAVKS